MPDRYHLAGRALLALSICFFGVQYLFYGRFVPELPPGQVWMPALPALAYALGVGLVVGGIAMFMPVWAARAGAIVGLTYIAAVVAIDAAHLPAVVFHGGARTNALEPLAIGSAALALAGGGSANPRRRAFGLAARYLFAFALCIFGWQHFSYTSYIATLLPSWVPVRVALVYLTGAGFIAAGLGFAANVRVALAGLLFAVMMFFFVVLAQIPDIVAHPFDGDAWSSLFVPIALCGGGLIIAANARVGVKRC